LRFDFKLKLRLSVRQLGTSTVDQQQNLAAA
jgi:hypothetical protein